MPLLVSFKAESVKFQEYFPIQGPVARRVKFNPELDETLNIIPSSRNTSGFSKLLLKSTSSHPVM